MPERSERRKALGGVLILLALLILAVVIVSLDEIIAARSATVDLYAELPQTEGLASGAAVWVAGHEVGEVLEVRLLPPARDSLDNRVLAVARVPRELLTLLRADSRADVTSRSLMGDAVLAISPGSPGAPRLEPTDTIRPAYGPERISAALESARRAVVEVDTLLARMRQVGALYRARRPMIERVTRSIDVASREMERTGQLLSEGPLPALQDARIAERFAALRASLATLEAGLARYAGGSLGGRMTGTRGRADSLRLELARLDSLATDPHGFVGRMRTDSALMVESARARAQMDSLVEEVMSNPLMFF